jgi:hypothetical protein
VAIHSLGIFGSINHYSPTRRKKLIQTGVAGISAGAGQPAEILRPRHLISIRGWCLTKMNGFPIPESRDNFRSAEPIKNAARVCRLRSDEG